jgi:WXG100 family type VII secretion target
MTTYQVSLEQMDFVKGEMETITKQINQTLSDLDDGIKQNLSSWAGDAQAAYRTAQAKWDLAAAKMNTDLAAATAAVGDIGDFYTSGEKYGVSLWDQ